MKVLITGANGFVGKNLAVHLKERKDIEVLCSFRDDDPALRLILFFILPGSIALRK